MHCDKPVSPAGVVKIILHALGGVILAGLFALVFGYVVMLLWNWVAVAVLGLSAVTFWQAVGITILAKILLSGLPFGPKQKSGYSHDKSHMFHEWSGEKDYMIKNRHMLKKFWECEGKQAFEEFKHRQSEEEK